MNKVLEQDIKDFAASFALSNDLQDATFLITGGTGLIGSTLIYCLLALDRTIKIVAPVRNVDKAEAMYEGYGNRVCIVECDLLDCGFDTIGKVDYIIHCAAPTASSFFVEHSAETFSVILQGTASLLEYANKYGIKGFVYLSSLEVYGSIIDDSIVVTEDVQGYLNPLSLRSSYPMAKRAAETLCYIYAKEFHLPVKIARLTQTTGAGVSKEDNRVIVQFARLAMEHKDIVLHTNGESARPYCYTMDAISAILYILLRGADGAAYNVANEMTYISVVDMAHFLKKEFAPHINIRFELDENSSYAPTTKLRLSALKLRALGWQPQYGLKQLFGRLIEYLHSS